MFLVCRIMKLLITRFKTLVMCIIIDRGYVYKFYVIQQGLQIQQLYFVCRK